MKIGIYNQPAGGALGGSEYLAAVLAQGLAADHDVELIHHHDGVDKDRIQAFGGLDLTNVDITFLEKQSYARGSSRLNTLTGRDGRSWLADVSARFDVFISICHAYPPFCHAPHGILYVLFPLYRREKDWPWIEAPRHTFDLWRRARRGMYEHEWRQRLASYQTVLSISEFTRQWTRNYWNTESSVVYPPVALRPGASKESRIVSVGRFTPSGHCKKHRELVAAFASLTDLHADGWRYDCMGSLGGSLEDREYYEQVETLATGTPTEVRVNVSRTELNQAYGRAKIFVHAAGLETGEDRPDLTEHFGIATVEAMAAGCVPVVVNKGAQPEIVEHGVSGLLWNTLEELQQCLRTLAKDDTARARMSAAAVARAHVFRGERFVAEVARTLPAVTAATA